jgi:hypothetical protein
MPTEHELFVIEDLMRILGQGIDYTLRDNVGPKGYALIVFDFHEPGLSNYISNAKREDMIKALRETANRLEKNQDVPVIRNRTIQ